MPSALDYLKTCRESLCDALSSLTLNKCYDEAHDLIDALKIVDGVIEKELKTGLYMGLNMEERNLIKAARFIDAIKALRTRTGCSLKDGKDLADAYRSRLVVAETDAYGNAKSYKEVG